MDLSRANIPTVDIRDKLKTVFTSENIKTVYVYVGKNIILKLAAKFVISAILNRNSLIFVSSREEAYKLSQANATE